ncbi:MAG: FtsX-like permease family protein [Steroidobacteraceae bacterium]|jgi:putative ABC transport system permease protein|nr:FtsX-like permease family protein [Steroidobacteraceae bacterium]
MRALERKLWRDLWRMRGQALAIALVMASGVAVLTMGLTTVESLDETARAYYERQRFAQIFAHVKRVPQHVSGQIAALPGVQTVETRIVHGAVLDIEGFEEPVVAQLVSLPTRKPALLNLLHLRAGRMPQAHATDEAVISEPFALAHGLQPGARVRAVLNGAWRTLRIVGVALSPEYVYTIAPGAFMPDDLRFGVLWLNEHTLQAAFDLQGAFNEVSVSLLRSASAAEVIEGMDRILRRYGGVGAIERADQASNWFLMNEIEQLRTLSKTLPSVFLVVAAFLTNMVLARLIAVERSEIGLLKAFGYTRREMAMHYVRFVLVIGALGVLLGWIAGYWLGRYYTQLFAEFFKFPFLLFRPGATPFIIGAAVGLSAALAGALRSVRKAATLAPAEAMLPPAPPLFRRTRLSQLALAAKLEQLTRIVLRQVARWPARSLTTCAGIAMSVAVLVVSMQWLDAVDHIVDVHFRQAQSQDVTVSFVEARSMQAARDLLRLPGVQSVEPMRVVPAKLRFGRNERREALQGLPARQDLYRVYDARGEPLTLPERGAAVSSMLAELLQVRRGDRIEVEVLEGRSRVFPLVVADIFETYMGSPVYVEIETLARMLGEQPMVNSVHLRVDPLQRAQLLRELKLLPAVGAITLKEAAIQSFDETMARTMLIFISFFIVFSGALAVGVTYNAARIALSERGRELAALRVLGFTRAEISYLLLGEIALLTLIALPIGCLVGWALARLMVSRFETELFRAPFIIEPSTYALAMIVGIAATTLCALIVRRRVDRLDLIGVLKTRE